MKLAILGYGKMGKLVDQLAPHYQFEVTHRLDIGYNPAELDANRPDAVIEFSTPEAAPENLVMLARLGLPTVCGTTGWFSQMDRVRAAWQTSHAALVWSANFSVGVNVFQRVVAEAARLLAGEPGYQAWAWEIHHSTKKDAPSGTLLKLVEVMREAGYPGTIDQGSNRAGAHPGTHEIGFDSAADTLTLRHTARSREGFARGALKAAAWIPGKKGVYEFREVLFGGGPCS